MFSSTMTALSIRRENTSAKPARIIVLMELPPTYSAMMAASTDIGIDRNTPTVARRLPRNTSTMRPVSTRPMPPSSSSVSMARFTNSDWSKTTSALSCAGMSSSRLTTVLHAVDDGDRVGVAALLHHRQERRPLAVHLDDVVLDLVGVLGVADVADAHHRAVGRRLERNPVDVGHVPELAVREDRVVVRPDLHVARRQNQVRVVDGAHHVHRAHLVRLELRRIDVHHDLPVLAAERLRHRRAGHARQLVADRELPDVAQLRLASAPRP